MTIQWFLSSYHKWPPGGHLKQLATFICLCHHLAHLWEHLTQASGERLYASTLSPNIWGTETLAFPAQPCPPNSWTLNKLAELSLVLCLWHGKWLIPAGMLSFFSSLPPGIGGKRTSTLLVSKYVPIEPRSQSTKGLLSSSHGKQFYYIFTMAWQGSPAFWSDHYAISTYLKLQLGHHQWSVSSFVLEHRLWHSNRNQSSQIRWNVLFLIWTVQRQEDVKARREFCSGWSPAAHPCVWLHGFHFSVIQQRGERKE